MGGLPAGVVSGTFRVSSPLIKPSRLTERCKGGVGKGLSTGWVVNFLIGCSFGCRFFYRDELHKKYSQSRVEELVMGQCGNYLAMPANLGEAIERTPWERWKGEETLLSATATNDPHLPLIAS